MKTGTQSAQDCAAVSLATPRGRKVCMNPLAQWLMPVALLALLLVEVGTAWGQTDVLPNVTVNHGGYLVNLEPSKTNEVVRIGPGAGSGYQFIYKAAGSPEPTVECTASGGPRVEDAGGAGYWQVSFTQADAGKTYTYTLIASNVAGVSKPATFTIAVKWNGPAIGAGAGAGPGAGVGAGAGAGPGTTRPNPRQDYRDYLSSLRPPAPAPRPVIFVRPGMIDQSAANRILTNPRLALRLGLAGGGGGGRNSTNAVPNGGNGNPPPLVGVPNAPAPINAVPNLPQGGN